jgi:hypothetical protein
MIEALNSKLELLSIESDERDIIRVVLNDEKEGMFICTNCKKFIIKDLKKFDNANNSNRLKVKCKCGHVFRAMVERRHSLRKSVNLVGRCLYIDNFRKANKQIIKIRDISMTGLQYSVNNFPEYRVGDTIVVDFRLDNRERTKIQEKAEVKYICSEKVGIQFEEKNLIGKLGIYLMG